MLASVRVSRVTPPRAARSTAGDGATLPPVMRASSSNSAVAGPVARASRLLASARPRCTTTSGSLAIPLGAAQPMIRPANDPNPAQADQRLRALRLELVGLAEVFLRLLQHGTRIVSPPVSPLGQVDADMAPSLP